MENRVGRTKKVLHKTLCPAVSMLLVILMAFSVCSVVVFADEDGQESDQTTVTNAQDNIVREIHVVYDNSGSMYCDYSSKVPQECGQLDRWCYAKYATEAFAAMLNPQDILKIYPMNKTRSLGVVYTESNPIVVSGANKEEGIKIIHDMYSVLGFDAETPFTTVETAAQGYGQNVKKYLLILTDGAFTALDAATDKWSAIDEDIVESKMEAICSGDLHVLYYGMGSAEKIDVDGLEKNEEKIGANNIVSKVSDACNYIFGRKILDKKYISNGKITFDISMKNIIVFAQGKSASLGNLGSISASPLEIKTDANTNGAAVIGKTVDLNGYIATYSSSNGYLEAGSYDLNYSGESIEVFYEPNIDVAYNLIDTSTGKPVVPNENNEIDSGEYKIDLYFVDALTGENITDSELIKGKNDNTLSATVKIEGQPDAVVEDGDSVVLSANKNTDITVKGTYLDYYTITGSGKNGLHNFTVVDNPFECKISIENDYFCTLNADSWESFVVNFEVDKHAVTADDFAKISLSEEDITIKDGKNDYNIAYDLTRDEENCCYKIRFKIPEGKSAASVCGKGTITVTAEYLLGGGVAEDSDKQSFEISTLPQWLKILIIVGSILLAILLIIFILTRKVYPKYMFIDVDGRKNRVNVSRGSTVIKPSGSMDAVTLSLKPTMNVFQKFFLKKNKVGVTGFNPSGAIDSFSFGTYSFQKDADGSWPEECLKLKRPTNLSLGHTAFQWTTENDFCGGNVSLRK